MNVAGRLKSIGKSLQASTVIVGSVVGAGFISGGELVRFFPSKGYLPYLLGAGVLFFLYFALLLACGKKYGGFDGVLAALFHRAAPAVRAVFGGCCFITCATMLAGIDSVFFETFRIPKTVPVLSALTLLAVAFVCRKGIGGIGKVNAVLVPAILVFVVAFALCERGAEYSFTVQSGSSSVAKSFLYAGMNVFLAAPLVCDLGKEVPPLPAAGVSSAVITLCAALVLGLICKEGANALCADMPLLYVVGKRGAVLGKVFSLVCLCGIITTLFSSYYPLHLAGEKRGVWFRAAVCLGALLLARIGLKGIISAIYPVLGFLGIAFACGVIVKVISKRGLTQGNK